MATWRERESEATREVARSGLTNIPQVQNQRNEMQNENIEQPNERHIGSSEPATCLSDYTS